jgi:hypothetical protein
MLRQWPKYAVTNRDALKHRRALLSVLLLLMCFVITGCQTVTPSTNRTLLDLQERATPKPVGRVGGYYTVEDEDGVWMLERIMEQSLPDASRVLSEDELPQEQAAVQQWMLQHLQGKYQVIERRFYLSRPGFTETSLVQSQAIAYVEQALGIAPLPGAWSDEKYKFMMWALKGAPSRYFALVIDNTPQQLLEQRLLVGYFELVPAPLVSCENDKCQAAEPPYSWLDRLRDRATPASLDRISPPREQKRAKAAMVQWMELFLHAKYQLAVKDQRFVLTQSGFTATASIRSTADLYVEQNLAAVRQPVIWYDGRSSSYHHDHKRGYEIMLWKLDGESPRYIAMVITSEFSPGTRKRSLVGYFELVPSE